MGRFIELRCSNRDCWAFKYGAEVEDVHFCSCCGEKTAYYKNVRGVCAQCGHKQPFGALHSHCAICGKNHLTWESVADPNDCRVLLEKEKAWQDEQRERRKQRRKTAKGVFWFIVWALAALAVSSGNVLYFFLKARNGE